MKRFAPTLFALLLVFVLLFSTSCTSNQDTIGKVVTCLGDIGFKVLASVPVDAEPLTFASLLDAGPVCLDAAVAAFTSSSSSSPEVDINEAPYQGVTSGSVYSNTWNNCTDSVYQLQFNFTIPFAMIIGPQDDQGTFTSSPTGSSDNDLIAHKLFDQYSNLLAQSITSGPSQSISLIVQPHYQITLKLPIQLQYKYGEAKVTHSDGNSVVLPWLFPVSYNQTGQTTYTATPC